jgi:RibD C-terminal domain
LVVGMALPKAPVDLGDLALEVVDQHHRGCDVRAPGLRYLEPIQEPPALDPEEIGDRTGPAEVDQGRMDPVLEHRAVLDQVEAKGGELALLADVGIGQPDRRHQYVVSSTLKDPQWSNSTVLEGDVVDEVSRPRHELDGDIVVHGSIRLARTLVEHDLVDELRLMMYPVVLGSGERLFNETSDKKPLRLVDTRTVGDGVAILTYEPIRDPGRGKQDGPEMIGAEAE